MSTIRVLLSRALDLMLRRRRDERLSEEIEAHLDLLTHDYIARGIDPAAARQAARRAFGGVDQMRAAYRDQRALPFLDALGQDVRFAGRLLRRDSGFAVTAVLVLGLGIGINNMLFTILNGHTLRGLPIANAGRIVAITTVDDRGPDRGVSYLDFADWRNAAHSLADLAAFTNAPMVVSEEHRAPDRFDGAFVSGNAFATIRVHPILGRDFRPEEDRPGAAASVMLGAGAWRSRYAGDPGILGRTIMVNGTPATIVGVMSDRSGFPSTAQIWLPLSQAPGLAAQPRDARSLRVLGRLRDGRSLSEARAEVEAIAQGLAQEHPETNTNIRAHVVPIDEQYFGSVNNPAWLAFMATGFIIVLISCANAANLLLAQSFHRAREIAIRTSLGASRRRVVRQLLIEGGVLAALGGTLGLSFAMVGVRLFRSAIPADALPYWIDYSPDVRVVAALIGVSAATIFLFALLPAIHVSRTDVNAVLKDGGRPGTGRRGRMWTTGFLAAEFALAVVFLAQFSVQLRNAGPRLPSDAVIDTKDVLTAAITIPPAKYATPDERDRFYRGLRERLNAQPIVSSMSIASALPLSGAEEQTLDIGGRAPADAKARPTVRTVAIAPGYFQTLGLTLGRGRDFTEADGGPGDAHAIVNERFVEQFLGTADPMGRRIAITPRQSPASAPNWLTIVGVAPSIRQRPSAVAEAVVYTPFRSVSPATGSLIVRGRVEPGELASLVREEVSKLDASLPVYRLRTMAQVMRDAQWNGRLSSNLFLMLTFIAVALATIGLYAVTAHGVAQRTQEIGLRMALGAQPRQVIRLIARRVAMQLAIGFMAGIVCTKLWDWKFGSGSAGVTASDPQSLLVVALILVLLAMVACVVPARRAIRMDPVVAIRQE
jgi:putative ABC transport system permease protein